MSEHLTKIRETAKRARENVQRQIDYIGTWRGKLQYALSSPKDYAWRSSIQSWMMAYDRDATYLLDELAAERERVRQMEEALHDREELIRWTAQSVHQAYHQHKAGTFRECSMSICRAATDALDAREPSEEGEV